MEKKSYVRAEDLSLCARGDRKMKINIILVEKGEAGWGKVFVHQGKLMVTVFY